MSVTYEYDRDFDDVNKRWDIGYNDPDEAIVEPSLIEEIFVAIGVRPIMACNSTCRLTFQTALSAGDKTTLDGVVAAHKAAAP